MYLTFQKHRYAQIFFSATERDASAYLGLPHRAQQTLQFANVLLIIAHRVPSVADVKFAGYRKAIFENGSHPSCRR